jgi:hypothetical protein
MMSRKALTRHDFSARRPLSVRPDRAEVVTFRIAAAAIAPRHLLSLRGVSVQMILTPSRQLLYA